MTCQVFSVLLECMGDGLVRVYVVEDRITLIVLLFDHFVRHFELVGQVVYVALELTDLSETVLVT